MSTSYEREVILSLFQAPGWFDLFELHERLLLSPAQIASVLMFLTGEGYCKVEGTKAKLTESGTIWVLRNRKKIFMVSDRKWTSTESTVSERRTPGDPYMPRLRSVDEDFFRKLA